MARWFKRADDGEAERWQDWLLTRDDVDVPDSWSMPFCFLYHNGWEDNGCGDWPLTYQVGASGTYPDSTEWHVVIDPSNWTFGIMFFKDTERRYTISSPEVLSIKQVIFQFGPLSMSRMRYKGK